MLDISEWSNSKKGNGSIILIAITAIVVISIIAVALIWNAMENSLADISTFAPSLETILIVALITGAIIAAIIFVVFQR